jgi:hypothetical protein
MVHLDQNFKKLMDRRNEGRIDGVHKCFYTVQKMSNGRVYSYYEHQLTLIPNRNYHNVIQTPTQKTILRLKEKKNNILKAEKSVDSLTDKTNQSILDFIEEELKELESILAYENKFLELTYRIGIQDGYSMRTQHALLISRK